jgi:hypothetical protein
MFSPDSPSRNRLAQVLAKPRKPVRKQRPNPKDAIIRISTEVLVNVLDTSLRDLTLDVKKGTVSLGSGTVGTFLSESDVQLDGIYGIETTLHRLLAVRKSFMGLQPIDPLQMRLLATFNNFHCSVFRYRPPGFKYREVSWEEVLENTVIKSFSSFRESLLRARPLAGGVQYRTNSEGHFYTETGTAIGAPAKPLPGAFRFKHFNGCAVYWKEELDAK